jgi:hypothetical protein
MQTNTTVHTVSMKYLKQCHNRCEMYVTKYKENSIHYAQLRCRQHGWIKWMSREQTQELRDVFIER